MTVLVPTVELVAVNEPVVKEPVVTVAHPTFPATVTLLPTFNDFPIPTPPATVKEPVVGEVESVKLLLFILDADIDAKVPLPEQLKLAV